MTTKKSMKNSQHAKRLTHLLLCKPQDLLWEIEHV